MLMGIFSLIDEFGVAINCAVLFLGGFSAHV
jgi:hypothetical protein